VVAPQTVYDLGRAWYATRMDRDWRRPEVEQAQQVFRGLGLDGPFWSLG
jgi:hypothetical protein